VAQHPESRAGESAEGWIPDVIRNTEASGKHHNASTVAVRRSADFIVSVAIGKRCKRARRCGASRGIEISPFGIRVDVKTPQDCDRGNDRNRQPNWPTIGLHVECSQSSQQRRFLTMPRSKKGSINRRGFLKG